MAETGGQIRLQAAHGQIMMMMKTQSPPPTSVIGPHGDRRERKLLSSSIPRRRKEITTLKGTQCLCLTFYQLVEDCIAETFPHFPLSYSTVVLGIQSWLQQQQIVVVIRLQGRIKSCRPWVEELSRRYISRQETGLHVHPDPSDQPQTLLKADLFSSGLVPSPG